MWTGLSVLSHSVLKDDISIAAHLLSLSFPYFDNKFPHPLAVMPKNLCKASPMLFLSSLSYGNPESIRSIGPEDSGGESISRTLTFLSRKSFMLTLMEYHLAVSLKKDFNSSDKRGSFSFCSL
jgi:hypothetical protein